MNDTGAVGDFESDQGREQMRIKAMAALRRGEFDLAEQAIARGDATLQELVENLRIYQIELQMQADELQRAQARTQQALDRFSALFTRLPVPALLIDANGVVLEANHHAEESFGVTSAMMRGYLFHRLVDADDYQAEVRGALLDARSGGHADVAAVRFRGRGGSQIVGDLHIECLTDAQSGALQYACVMIDRTEQLADLERLQASLARLQAREQENQRLAEVAMRAPTMVLLTDARQCVRWANEAMLRTTGYALTDIAGQHAATLLAPADSGSADGADLHARLDAGEPLQGVVALAQCKDGRTLRVALQVQPILGGADGARQYLILQTELPGSDAA